MKRLSTQEKEKIKILFDKGLSKHKIARIMNISRTAVRYNCGHKGKYFPPIKKILVTYSQNSGEVIGIFAGDGSQYFEPKSYHYTVNVHFGMKNLKYILYVKGLYEKIFNKKFRIEKSNPTTLRLTTYSKEIYNFFTNYLDYNTKIKHSTVKLKNIKFPLNFKIGFLRGLFDTDGSIWFIKKEKRWKAVYYTTSKLLAYQISTILSKLGINNGMHVQIRNYRSEKPVYYVNIWKNSVDKFINVVKPLKARTGKGPVAKPGIVLPWLGRP